MTTEVEYTVEDKELNLWKKFKERTEMTIESLENNLAIERECLTLAINKVAFLTNK